jgi:hypothetical protein
MRTSRSGQDVVTMPTRSSCAVYVGRVERCWVGSTSERLPSGDGTLKAGISLDAASGRRRGAADERWREKGKPRDPSADGLLMHCV